MFARWPLEEHGLRWVHPRYCFAHPLPDGAAVVHARDVGETAASLDAAAPGDGAAWAEFVEPYLDHFGAWRDTLLGGFPPVTGATKLAAALGPAATLEWARLLLMPAEALAGHCSRPAARAPGSTGPRCTATSRPTAPAARSPRRTSA